MIMTSLLLLTGLNVLIQATPDRGCPPECDAVLTAALEWAIDRLPEGQRERLFLDAREYPSIPPAPGVAAPAEIEASVLRSAMQRIATRRDIPWMTREQSPAWTACRQSEQCRGVPATPSLSFRNVEFISDEEAKVTVVLEVLGDLGRRFANNYTYVDELRLTRDTARWTVTEVTNVLVVN